MLVDACTCSLHVEVCMYVPAVCMLKGACTCSLHVEVCMYVQCACRCLNIHTISYGCWGMFYARTYVTALDHVRSILLAGFLIMTKVLSCGAWQNCYIQRLHALMSQPNLWWFQFPNQFRSVIWNQSQFQQSEFGLYLDMCVVLPE